MGSKKCGFGRALLCAGALILMLTFCSFRFICTVTAIILIIAGIKALSCC